MTILAAPNTAESFSFEPTIFTLLPQISFDFSDNAVSAASMKLSDLESIHPIIISSGFNAFTNCAIEEPKYVPAVFRRSFAVLSFSEATMSPIDFDFFVLAL